jgi:hypothetical protein
MPLGEIRPLELTKDQKVYRDYLAHLSYPAHAAWIYHLPKTVFFDWLYGLNPRDALLLSVDPGFRETMVHQKTKTWPVEVYDALWRGYAHVFGK